MEFTRDGADCARELIDDCLCQAKKGMLDSLKNRNRGRFDYWKPRLIHLMKEADWIQEIIRKIEAADDEADRQNNK